MPNSLKVYSSKTSLFVRSFDLPGINDDIALDSDTRIVSYSIDPLDGNRIFVATYTGWVYLWDWALGQLVESWNTGRNIQLMEVAKGEEESPSPVEEDEQYTIPTSGRMVYIVSRPYEGTPSKKSVDAAKPAAATEVKQAESTGNTNKLQSEFELINQFTDKLVQKQIAEMKSQGEWDWFFHKAILLPKGANGNNTTVELKVLFRVSKPVTAFKVAAKGEIFVAIAGNTMWIGNRNESPIDRGYGKLPVWGVWRSVDVKNQASCLDIQVFAEGKGKKSKGAEKKIRGLVAVGDVTGAIFLWHNILTPGSTGDQPGDIRRMHWHRGCVGSVKISEDGKFPISNNFSEWLMANIYFKAIILFPVVTRPSWSYGKSIPALSSSFLISHLPLRALWSHPLEPLMQSALPITRSWSCQPPNSSQKPTSPVFNPPQFHSAFKISLIQVSSRQSTTSHLNQHSRVLVCNAQFTPQSKIRFCSQRQVTLHQQSSLLVTTK